MSKRQVEKERERMRAQQPCHVTRFRNVVCMALHRRMTTSGAERSGAAVTCKYIRHVWWCVRRITHAAMCRIHVAPSRRPSDVLLGSRNSLCYIAIVLPMLCVLLAREYVRTCAGAYMTPSYTRRVILASADVTIANYAIDSVNRFDAPRRRRFLYTYVHVL